MTVSAPLLTAAFWRSRRSAAIAGIIFGVLLLLAMTMLRIALSADSLQSLRTDSERRTLIRLSLHLVPVPASPSCGSSVSSATSSVGLRIACSPRSFSAAGWLFVAMLFVGAGTSTSLMASLAGTSVNAEVYAFGRKTIRSLFSIYAMRMAAVFTLAVSPVGIRTSAVPRWVRDLGYLVGLTLLVAAGAYQWTPARIPCLG